jgi:hypothetical protein
MFCASIYSEKYQVRHSKIGATVGVKEYCISYDREGI